jgi:hypothetical protein
MSMTILMTQNKQHFIDSHLAVKPIRSGSGERATGGHQLGERRTACLTLGPPSWIPLGSSRSPAQTPLVAAFMQVISWCMNEAWPTRTAARPADADDDLLARARRACPTPARPAPRPRDAQPARPRAGPIAPASRPPLGHGRGDARVVLVLRGSVVGITHHPGRHRARGVDAAPG